MTDPTRADFRRRDAATLTIIGAFFMLLSLLIFAAVFWEDIGTTGMYVNVGAGLALLSIGIGMIYFGRRLRR